MASRVQADPEYILRFRSDDAQRVLSSLAATTSGSALQVLQETIATATTGSKFWETVQRVQLESWPLQPDWMLCFPPVGISSSGSFARQAGGGGSKAQAQNLLAQARAAAKAAKAAGGTAHKAASEDVPAGDGSAGAPPSGPDPRLQAPKRKPVTVRAKRIPPSISHVKTSPSH